MKKFILKYKELIIASLIIILIIIFQVFNFKNNNIKSTNKISQNQQTENILNEINIATENNFSNNSAINLQKEKEYSMGKGSLFVKIDNIVIYNNFDNDINIIDLKTNTKKVLCTLEDGVNKMYFDGEYVYAVPYYYRGKGIYKIDLNGNINKICDDASLQLLITEDKIYYVKQTSWDDMNQNLQGDLYVMDKDGNNKTLLIQGVRNSFEIMSDKIYYTDQNTKGIFRSNIDGTNKEKLADGRTYITKVTEKCLTYVDYEGGEKQKIIYLDTNEVKEVGRFGNSFSSENETYVYTRKYISEDNNIENEYRLYKIDTENYSENEIWSNDTPLEVLIYVYNDYAYFRGGNEFYRINLKNNKKEKEKLDMSLNYIIGDKAYSLSSSDEKGVYSLNIYDLEKNEITKIEF